METPVETLSVNGVEYVRKDAIKNTEPSVNTDGLPYVIVRSRYAGVYAGYLAERDGQEVVVKQARLLYYWEGAASLSQLALEGVKVPGSCKFPQELPSITILDACAILPCTESARKSIAAVAVWKR